MINPKPGTITAICSNDKSSPLIKNPIFQIVSVKQMDKKSKSDPEKYIVNLSDTQYYVKARLSDYCSSLFTNKELSSFSVVEIKSYKTFNKSGNCYLYITEILRYENRNERIGTPENYNLISESSSPNNSSNNENSVKKQKITNEGKNSIENKTQTKNDKNEEIQMAATLNPYSKNFSLILGCYSFDDRENFVSAEMFDKTARIRIISYGDNAKKLVGLVKVGGKYKITNGSIKLTKREPIASENKNPIYKLRLSEFEIIYEKQSEITFIEDISSEIYRDFTKINDLNESGEYNIQCLIKTIYPTTEMASKYGRKIKKKDIMVADFSTFESETSNEKVKEPMKITLWNNFGERDLEINSTAIFMNVKVNLYNNNITLNTISSSTICTDVSEEISAQLIEKSNKFPFDSSNKSSASDYKNCNTISQLKLEKEEDDEKRPNDVNDLTSDTQKSYFTTYATISYIKPQNLFYFSCEICKKKVPADNVDPEDINELNTYCEKCQKSTNTILQSCFTISIADYTGSLFLTMFSDGFETIFGYSLNEGYETYSKEPATFSERIHELTGKIFKFVILRKLEIYNGESRYKYSALRTTTVDAKKVAREVMDSIKSSNN